MQYPRLIISALSGGAGKTTLSLGLARALKNHFANEVKAKQAKLDTTKNEYLKPDLLVKTFKKGPDYIDSAWLGFASGSTNGTLDPYFSTKEELLQLFMQGAEDFKMSLIEGNRGLFDGLDIEGSCSTARLATILHAPVLLVLDCTKMTRTAAALVHGCNSFEAQLKIGAVLLNQIGTARQAKIIKESIEKLAKVPVLGVLPRQKSALMPEREMGLYDFEDREEADEMVENIASFINNNLDLNDFIELANSAPALDPNLIKNHNKPDAASLDGHHLRQDPSSSKSSASSKHLVTSSFDEKARESQAETKAKVSHIKPQKRTRIGFIRDKALWHYYPENFKALQEQGIELLPLSILDSKLWPELDGLYLGGGLPELYVKTLSANQGRCQEVRHLASKGLPIYAESGGMVYLCSKIFIDGVDYPMVNLFPYTVHLDKRPVGLGYTKAKVIDENPFYPKGFKIKGHEFHYSFCQKNNGVTPAYETRVCLELDRGTGLARNDQLHSYDGLSSFNTFGSYTHIFAPSVPEWAINFAKLAKKYSSLKSV